MSLQLDANAVRLSTATEQGLSTITRLQKGAQRLAQPIAIIGPGDGGERECDAAFAIAYHLARAGLVLVCGGRSGVMEAASRAAAQAGGFMIGLLPENDATQANPYLSVALPTGMGEMRNALIARSSLGLIAVGGGLGTISEMALGLKLGKPVFSVYEEVALTGLRSFAQPDALLAAVVDWLVVQMKEQVRS
jgi:uncharacterized protein (TIGR00725 family)